MPKSPEQLRAELQRLAQVRPEPVEAEPVEAEPVEAEPAEAGPAEAEPVDAKPVDVVEVEEEGEAECSHPAEARDYQSGTCAACGAILWD
ncbi:MAG TPA: hypothetical protein VFV73_11975 [Streptosporangiaceae bacterium]|nr:hypothetical protein [Streptosporangiaceae bacterium]